MPPLVQNLNFMLALSTLALQVALVSLFLVFIFRKKLPGAFPVLRFIETYALHFAFFLALSSVVMSLIYSEVFGFIPCGLCWMQRVFLYPQAVILGIALSKKDTKVADYIIALSVFGALFALDQHFLQMGGGGFLPCPASGNGDCAKRILFEFGYITFPLLSFTAFLSQIALMLVLKKKA